MTESQNPLGYSMSETNKQRLAELVNHYQIPMIEDDVYRELGIGNPSSLPAKAYDKVGNILLCGSFSKSLSPGFVSVGRCGRTRLKHPTLTAFVHSF